MTTEASIEKPDKDERRARSRGMLSKMLSLLSDVAVYGISSMLSQLIGFLLLPLYTRYLTPHDQGVVAMVVTVTAFFGPIANLGIVQAIFRRFNHEKTDQGRGQVLSTALVSVTISSLVALALSAFFAAGLSRLAVGDDSATNIVHLTLLTAAVTSIGLVPLAILRADRRVKTTAAANVAKLLLSVSATIWLVVFEGLGVWGVVVGSLIGESTLAVVLFVITAKWFRFGVDFAVWKRLMSYGLPFVPHQLQGMVMTLVGQYAVGEMLGLDEAGLYSIATRFSLPVAFVVNSVNRAWVAYKFQMHAEDDDPATFFRTTTTYYVAVIMYLWVGVSLWGPELVWLLTEKSYHSAAWLVAITALIPVAQGVYFMLGTGMELGEDVRSMPLVTLAGLITAVISVLTLVKPLGAAGAAIATINAFIALSVVIFILAQKRIAIPHDWPSLSSLFGIAVAAVVVGYLSLGLPAIERLSLAVAISLVFPFVEFAILLRSSTERERMRILWSKATQLLRRSSRVGTVGDG
jgi:O-antigen/teichoic acid export membrane protein